MLRGASLAVMTVLAALCSMATDAGAAGWDPTPLPLSPQTDHPPQLGPLVETTDDGAAWVMWAEDPDQDNQYDVVVRRVGSDGVPGERRVLTSTDPSYFGSIALAPLPGGDVRVAYTSEGAAKLEERRLTPTSTGAPEVLYDEATTDDGNTADNGHVYPVSVKVLSAPGGASWVSFVRMNAGTTPVVSARRIADDDSVGALAVLAQPAYEYDAAVDPSGRLVFAAGSGGQARMVAVRVDTNGDVGPELEIRAAYGLGGLSATPAIGIDAAGIATTGWRLDTPTDRFIEGRRVDTTTTPMTALGAGVTAMNDDLPQDFVQYGPLFGVDPGGGVLMGWYETDSNQSNNDAMVRVLAEGALATPGVIGPRMQLDGPPPEGGSVSDLVPGPSGIVTAFFYTDSRGCGAPRVDMASGSVISSDVIAAAGCAAPAGPASGVDGVAATWTDYPSWQVVLKRYVSDAPSCTDGTPVTVAAGASAALSLPCTGWRPQREIIGAPARGTLGAIDQDAGTVTYTAGLQGGSDEVRFRGTNGAGASQERSVAVTVTPAPVTPGGPTPPPPDTSDHTPPVLTGLSLKPGRVSRAKPRSPVLGFSLSEAATVRATVQRLVNGRRRAGRCVTPPPRRGRTCVKARTVKRLSGAFPAGASRLTITLGRRLVPGRYRVTVRATDAAGNASAVQRISLRITRR